MVIREQLDHKKRGNLKSLGVWRKKFTELSIQDEHKFNHYRGGKGPHNSQMHKLENDTIEPYLQVYKSLAGMMHELNEEENFFYVPELKLRERLKNAKPYLTHDGRIPTMIDFIEIFEGLQPVNKMYLETISVSQDEIENYGKHLSIYFKDIKRSEMLEPKEAWQSFINQPYSKTISKNDLDTINDILRGEKVLSQKILINFGATYGKCPMIPVLQSMSNLPIPTTLKKANQKMESFVASELNNNCATV